ncbi:MAG: DegT/DnrJ/EryC1/StrS family aminotransferase [Planctomycetaceae bacterium]|nr:DegT/DnrJ/EryC1/StrS family aminotransferase [Planctomycetaceae bacterium]
MSSEAILSIHSAPRPAPVPLIDLVEQHASIREEVHAAVDAVLDSQRFILGDEVVGLEQEVAGYCDARHAIGCASGTDALVLALMALDVGPGDEVITTPFTFFATASAIHRVGARPVFADIDPVSFNLDPEAVAAAITPRTKAIMPVHLFGRCAEMEPLWRLAVRHGLAIVEDAAQAIGSTYRGRHAGVLGTIACFSFFPTKNLGGAGDGGMLATDDCDLDVRLRRLRVHGDVGRYEHLEIGLNSRLDALQAAVLRVKLRHLESWTQARRENAARYQERFSAAGTAEHMVLPTEAPGSRHVYNQYCVRVREGRRDAVLQSLQSRQIGCAVYYPKPLHLQPCFDFLGHKPGEFPQAEAAAGEVLALPIYPELGAARLERAASAVIDAVKQTAHRSITIPFRDAARKAA